jgi:hypothetical protein
MSTCRLTRTDPLKENVRLEVEDGIFSGIEFEPGPGKMYLFSVEVGDSPPAEVKVHLDYVAKVIRQSMPHNSVMVVPCRNGHPEIGIYEVSVVDEAG